LKPWDFTGRIPHTARTFRLFGAPLVSGLPRPTIGALNRDVDADTITLAWLILGIVLMLLELLVPGLVVVFLGAGAIIVAAARWLGLVDGWMASIGLWLGSSLVLIFSLRDFFSRIGGGRQERSPTDEDRALVGKVVEVMEAVGPQQEGRIRLGGTTWRARCDVERIEAGGQARIAFRDEMIWVVEPLD